MGNDPMLEMYVMESVQLTERLEEILIGCEQLGKFNVDHINEIFRIMHTVKGSAAMMEYEKITLLAHSLEDMFYYIREHEDSQPDWSEIADICLEAVDFFKTEVAKISGGLVSDGDMSNLLERCHKCLAELNGTAVKTGESEKQTQAAADFVNTASAGAVQEETEGEVSPAGGGDSGLNCFKIKLFFEEGCKMENIRAYQIVNSLTDYADRIDTYPADFLEDCSDEIVRNGATLTVYTKCAQDKIKDIVNEALFLRSFDITSLNVDTSPGDKTQEMPNPEEKTEAAPEQTTEVKEPEPGLPKSIVPGVAHNDMSKTVAPIEKPTQESIRTELGASAVKKELETIQHEKMVAAVTNAPVAAAANASAASVASAPAEIKQTFLNVNVDKLDKLMDLMGEIVISVSMVVGSPDLEGLQLDNFEKAASQLLKNTNELQEVIMSVRMIPISSTFHKMSRIVRDTSKKLNKEVELVILGEETEVDKNIIDNLSDPLMHIIRNSLDHGLEDTPEMRELAGKPRMGRIVLEARNSGSDVIISCTDDGRGFNKEKILAKALKNGLLSRPDTEYTDREIYQFIMLPGFSTNEQVTELSGRGVGMDVVKKNIERVGGTVLLDSVPGQGSTVTIRIPLTLAILASIEIRVGRNLYLIPTLNIREAFKPKKEDIVIDPDGNEMILFRGECYSIVRLHRLFRVNTQVTDFDQGIMVMIEDEGRMAGIFADEMVSEQQAVVKPIPSFITERIGQIRGISGCTIMGNGNIDLIIDVKSLTQ